MIRIKGGYRIRYNKYYTQGNLFAAIKRTEISVTREQNRGFGITKKTPEIASEAFENTEINLKLGMLGLTVR